MRTVTELRHNWEPGSPRDTDNGGMRDAFLIIPGVLAAAGGGEMFVRAAVGPELAHVFVIVRGRSR